MSSNLSFKTLPSASGQLDSSWCTKMTLSSTACTHARGWQRMHKVDDADNCFNSKACKSMLVHNNSSWKAGQASRLYGKQKKPSYLERPDHNYRLLGAGEEAQLYLGLDVCLVGHLGKRACGQEGGVHAG
eukprot:1156753-Pelagomonas_calceolata.AAC.12